MQSAEELFIQAPIMKKSYDIIIVGDGILGLSTAFSLLQKDTNLKVAIIAPHYKNAATISAGAMLNCFAEITETSFLTEPKKRKFQMSFQALQKWPEWIEQVNQFTSNKLKIQEGTYVLLNAKSGTLDTKNFLSIIKSLDDYKEPYQEISPEDIPGINPIGSCRPLRAIHLPKEGNINPIEVLNTLKTVLSSIYDVEFISASVTNVTYTQSSINGVIIESGQKIFSNTVLLATGSYTQKIIDGIPEIKNQIPMTLAGKGMAALIKPTHHSITGVIRTPNRAGACGLHVVPRDANTLYVGATNNIFHTPGSSVNLGLAQFLLKCAIEQIDQNFYNAEIQDWIVGNRPVTVDTFPLIGEVSIKGLYLLAGTYRDGFLLSTYLSEYCANLMLNDSDIETNNIFKPERDFIQTTNIQDSIDECLVHYLAGSYEHHMNLPSFLSEEKFLNPFRQEIKKLYDKLEIDFGLAPEIMIMLFLSDNPDLISKTLKQHLKKLCPKGIIKAKAA
jgi:glycine/D-amino acid oxidase-like deaminating enzyme